jgi:hypothetical protein
VEKRNALHKPTDESHPSPEDGEVTTASDASPGERRRRKISVTVDPILLGTVDTFVAAHPEYDRSRVIDDALFLWYAQQQDRAMEAQFLAEESTVEVEEHGGWGQIQVAAVTRLFSRD